MLHLGSRSNYIRASACYGLLKILTRDEPRRRYRPRIKVSGVNWPEAVPPQAHTPPGSADRQPPVVHLHHTIPFTAGS